MGASWLGGEVLSFSGLSFSYYSCGRQIWWAMSLSCASAALSGASGGYTETSALCLRRRELRMAAT